MKKIIAFDLDDTLNITKSPLDTEMAELVKKLLDRFHVMIVSGTNWELLREFCVAPVAKISGVKLSNYHIMPTTGTQYWHYVGEGFSDMRKGQILENGWLREYYQGLTDEQAQKISTALEKATKKLGFWINNPTGEIIENRGSQITYSALGQFAKKEDKYAWDPDTKKRQKIIAEIQPEIDELNVIAGIGGTTSVDVALPGVDKEFAIRELMKMTSVKMDEILFVGDKLQPGGNDFPVKKMGVETIEVRNCEDTKWVIRGILGVS